MAVEGVGIVTDSAAALPQDLVDALGIFVVPMYLTIEGDSFREGERPVDVLAHPERVKTSGPTPADFADALGLADTGQGAVVLTIAATMSSTHESAFIAAREISSDPRRRIIVIDTTTAAGAEGLVVLAAATAARRGASIDDVATEARRAIEEVRLVATVPNLDHLVRSGRVPGVAGWAGRRLGISPLFEFRDGKARPLRPALSLEAAYERMLSAWRKDHVEHARLHVAALHAEAPAAAEALLQRVRTECTARGIEPASSFMAQFGLVMVVHAGPGLVGLAWRWEREPA